MASRLCVIYRVANLIVFFEPAKLCNLQPDLFLAPLPHKKQLWEASDERSWKLESTTSTEFHTSLGIAITGELVEVEEGRLYKSDQPLIDAPLNGSNASRRTASWEDWCSTMDNLGSLVLLAASLMG